MEAIITTAFCTKKATTVVFNPAYELKKILKVLRKYLRSPAVKPPQPSKVVQKTEVEVDYPSDEEYENMENERLEALHKQQALSVN